MEPAGSNVGARARSKRAAAAAARAGRRRQGGSRHPAALLGYNLRRAHQASWRTYVSFIGENKIRPGLFSLLC